MYLRALKNYSSPKLGEVLRSSGGVCQTLDVRLPLQVAIPLAAGIGVDHWAGLLGQSLHCQVALVEADAVVGVRYGSSSVMQGAAEVVAYGTAVKLK